MLNESSTVQELLAEIRAKKERLIKEKKIKKAKPLPPIDNDEQPFEIPNNWKWVRLGDIATIITGTTPSKKEPSYYGGNFPFYKPSNIQSNKYLYPADEYLSELGKAQARFIPKNSIAVNCIGNIGKAAMFPTDGTTNQQINSICHYLYPEYLYWVCQSDFFITQLLDFSSATTISIVNKSKVERTIIPLPPLFEQHRLVARIESLFAKLDAAREKVQSVLDSHETRKAALLHDAFAGKLTAKWRDGQSTKSFSWKPISFEDCIEKMQNGLSKRKGDAGEYVNVLRLTNIAPEGLSFQDMRKILLTSDEKEKYKLAPEDVLMVRVNGSKDNVGKQLYIDKKDADNQLTFCDHLIRIHYNEQLVAPQFMVYFSHTMQYKSYVEKNMVSSAGQNTISRKGMKNLSLMLPSLPEQQQIVRILDRLLAREQRARQAAEETLTAIDRMKQSILARAFRGEL